MDDALKMVKAVMKIEVMMKIKATMTMILLLVTFQDTSLNCFGILFELFFDEEVWNMIVDQSIVYANFKLRVQ